VLGAGLGAVDEAGLVELQPVIAKLIPKTIRLDFILVPPMNNFGGISLSKLMRIVIM
jgi:hypothetical protein